MPEKIWPWIIQLGTGAGWVLQLYMAGEYFSRRHAERLRNPKHASTTSLPGDTIWLANKGNYNGNGFQIVAEIIPNRSFVMVGG
jgi:hypothetical protein